MTKKNSNAPLYALFTIDLLPMRKAFVALLLLFKRLYSIATKVFPQIVPQL